MNNSPTNDNRFQEELMKMEQFVRFYPTKECAVQNQSCITDIHFPQQGYLNYMDDGESKSVSRLIMELTGLQTVRWINHLTFVSGNGITSFKDYMLLTFPDLIMS